MRVLVPLDTSETGESAAVAMAAWSRTVPIEVHLFSVIEPGESHLSTENSNTGEFLEPEDTEPGHIPAFSWSQYGDTAAVRGDPAPRTVEFRGQALARARDERENYLRALAARDLASADVTIHVEFAEQTAEAILAAAETLEVDAIAMGTHGRSGIRHVLMGSVAEQITRQSRIPVVVLGPQAHAGRMHAPSAG